MSVSYEIYDIYGNPTHPMISPDFLLRVESSPREHPFSVRLNSFMLNIWGRLVYYLYLLPKADSTVKKYFGNEYPHLGEICRKRSSILMTNVNFITHPLRANVPNVIEVDQIHIKKNHSLPKVISLFNRCITYLIEIHSISIAYKIHSIWIRISLRMRARGCVWVFEPMRKCYSYK